MIVKPTNFKMFTKLILFDGFSDKYYLITLNHNHLLAFPRDKLARDSLCNNNVRVVLLVCVLILVCTQTIRISLGHKKKQELEHR